MKALQLSEGARRALADADAALSRWAPRSLAPGREASLPARAVVEQVAAADDPPALVDALAQALREVSLAAASAFPENLFWDAELLAASLLRAGRADGPACVAELGGRVARLQVLYGRGTAINFRYVHDFLYGYDWAKWISRDPPARADAGPFDREFLIHMDRRAHELLALIAENDERYPTLPEGQIRNPFPFSREPPAEALLLQDLAARGLVPVEAWDQDAAPRWDRPWADLRAERAQALGLGCETTSPSGQVPADG